MGNQGDPERRGRTSRGRTKGGASRSDGADAPRREHKPFDHSRVGLTSEESKKNLFSKRRKQASRQRKREKRQNVLRSVVLPAVVIVFFVAAAIVTVYTMFFRDPETEPKLKKASVIGVDGGSSSYAPVAKPAGLMKPGTAT